MYFSRTPVTLGIACSPTTATTSPLSDVTALRVTLPWQYLAQQTEPEHWFQQFNETLSTMRTTYWSGRNWSSTSQWINAILNTLILSSATSMTMLRDGDDFGTTAASLRLAVQDLYSDIRLFHDYEDTTQIFGAAYDDAQWVVLEWLEAIQLIERLDPQAKVRSAQDDIVRFAHSAHVFYNIVQDKFDLSLCGGGLT